jgi:hypothetical protein
VVRNSNTWTLYVNGVSEATATFSGSLDGTATPRIGIGRANATGTSAAGYIDELRISKTARYTANFTPSTTAFQHDDNNVLLLHMDGTNGSTTFLDDSGGRSQKGITAFGNAQVDTAQSKFGGASALFDGTGDYLQIAQTSDLTLTSQATWTLECYARFANLTGIKGIASQATNPGSNGFGWAFYTNGTNLLWYIGNANFINTSGFTLAVNTWYHIAIVRNGSQFNIYINGTSYYSNSSYASSSDPTAPVFIGVSPGISSGNWDGVTYFMNGHLDEFRISNTARYTANFTAPTAPFQNDDNTALLLHMDGTDASTVFIDDNGAKPYTL